MDDSTEQDEAHRRRAQARIIAPVRDTLRRAALLAVAAGLIWPLQAALIAWVISIWVTSGGSDTGAADNALLAIAGFVALGVIRAGLDRLSGRLLFDAADRTIARERAILIRREARNPSEAGSAEVSALAVQKLPLLQAWVTRYHVAMMRTAVLPLALAVLAFTISWAAALILLISGPLIPMFMALVGMAAEDASRQQMREIGSMNDMLMERLSAMLDIRLLGATKRAARDFETRAESLREKSMAVLRIAFLSSTVLELFAAIGVAMMAVFVGFSLLGELNFGTWGTPLSLREGIFLLLIAPEFFQPMRDLAAAWHDRAAGYAVVADLDALDEAERVALVGTGARAAPLEGQATVAVSKAVAALPGRALPLPDLQLKAGESVALTGPSGSGKTTALASIAGLVPLDAGAITVCGHTLDAQTADAWRARLSLIPQRPHFPDETLRVWLDPEDTGRDPSPALDIAGARDVVERLPHGLATTLGETGGGVSGGEARRLMIARAALDDSNVILADEPTADLDAETAKRIIEALVRLKDQGRTLIVATHDPALAAAMDRQVHLPLMHAPFASEGAS
ncbi:ABC transporter ATP-binding protein/permease [Methyloceanibacter caenitepidi]|uniref:Transport ATP-binding protein CydD n=1 Tax=Methyloceanibacter caenitepidi TaxID=1384459 RepID=A0A0A8K741_9HYPH|nr:ATP-binding cassette domain-containing protein [Methyloceanibacter caenitepidi]BAQ18740.1 transport ATP-binding protein CydD [Methyloceanibacter caenitepidi]